MEKNFKNGFTLIEIVVVLGIFMLLLVGLGYLMLGTFRAQYITFSQLQGQKEARTAVENFVKEARRADTSSIGSYLIDTATASVFAFYSDIDADTYREKVRYFLDGKNFKKGVIKPTGTPLTYNPVNEVITIVAQNVISNQIFSFYDENYDGTTAALTFPVNVTDIRLAKITLTIEQDAYVSPEPLIVTSQVKIRNLKE
ncbi:MAG: type II secretion system protein [Candidatus Magasanikbacteria bacterium]|nr:type II secretion system protein [Candidatus Magasanikbacteria bacterium]